MKSNKLNLTIIAALIATQFSCMNYYKISKNAQNTSTPDTVIHANPERYFILRNGDSAYHMNNIISYKDSLQCSLETLPVEHRLHLRNGRNGNMRFKKYKSDSVVLNEIHIYQKPDNKVKPRENFVLTYKNIQKIEVLEKNKTRTAISYVLGGLAIASPFIAIIIMSAVGGGYYCPSC